MSSTIKQAEPRKTATAHKNASHDELMQQRPCIGPRAQRPSRR